MSIFVRDTGDLEFYQGDDGSFSVAGLPTDQDYQVYFAVRDPNTNSAIMAELVQSSNKASSVTYTLSSIQTDAFEVPAGQSKVSYSYAVKICSPTGSETTVIPKTTLDASGNPVFAKCPKVIVHAKRVSGRGI